ncbi:T9SS type A sorting domain-containing protein [Polaribacter sp. Z022]|uniref:T9SS type A sorting domain-containing protein n=1 Tax=Polaribacter sp. Z022 TaxID=2927125 RepID=UPI00201FF1E9|nr:T9SS type A sorting domain-containing protein [Polaribacter sp. Z022]MCL7753300.1 T9SS type A sorting domain-containing protein [Polaribacter sp. Z022]
MKKIMCFMLFVSIALQGWSQELHVASGGAMYVSSESYVYVDDDVDVVSGGDLTINSDATHSGSFLVTGSASGDISYQRYVTGNRWHFVSAPVTTQAIGDFATEAANDVGVSSTGNYGISFYKNDNAQGTRWQYYTVAAGALGASTAGDFVSGKGYSNFRDSDGIYTFTGEMATTDVSITIPANAILPDVSTNHLWSVVGNPYPSFINGAALLTANQSNLDPNYNQLNVWNGSDYQVVNFANPAKIAPGQAFMVDPAQNNVTFTFTKSLQSIQEEATATFYRTAATPEITVKLKSGKDTKTTSLKYFNNTTTGLDSGWDAGTYQDSNPTFALDTHLVSGSNGINFTLQCLPNFNYQSSVVPLSVVAKANQTLAFSTTTANLPEGINVYIEDKVTNTITDISTGTYNVIPTEALNGIGRFYLHTASSVLSTEDNLLTNALNLYKTNNSTLRVIGLQNQANTTINMYSITGKQVLAKQFSAQNVQDIALPKSLATGIYVVNVISDKVEFTKKIIIE